MPLPLFAPRRATTEPSAVAIASPELSGDAGATSTPPPNKLHGYAREAAALILIASALYSVLALASYRRDPMRPEIVGADWVGPVGNAFAGGAVNAVGLAAWFLPIELVLLSGPLLKGKKSSFGLTRLAGDVVVIVVLAALAHVAFPLLTWFGAMPIGGAVGELFGEVMRSLFSSIGSYIIGLTIVALILIGRATFSFIEAMRKVESIVQTLSERGSGGLRALIAAWIKARELDREDDEGELVIARKSQPDAIIAALVDDSVPALPEDDLDWPLEPAHAAPALVAKRMAAPAPIEPVIEAEAEPEPIEPKKRGRKASAAKQLPPAIIEAPIEVEAALPEVATPSPIAPVVAAPAPILSREEDKPKPAARKAPPPQEPKIVDTSAALAPEKAEVIKVVPAVGLGFRLPTTDMLEAPNAASRPIVDEEQLKVTAQLLEKTLSDYGVSGKVEEIHPGPTVTTFEVSPAAGTKVSKVAGLADDLALGLSRKVRIIAPIPGKNRIGFEIPNPERVPVSLRELVEDRRFQEMKAPLPCVLGRDIIGAPYFADLASMPHVIVAGATGAGKSVGLNVMLVSLLFRKTPEELRLLMIDPKVVELAPFDRIPHMLLPVVTDMKQAANALKWAVDEMERRYQLFANAGTKNITTYNGWVERVLRGEIRPPKPPKDAKVSAVGFDGLEVEVEAAKDGSDIQLPEKIPFIVIVVDEFADLMMQQGKDVEASVARLAQKARAAGMHVILATQRPSVDVITGMIKANFPTRIAFRVAQKVDSRTILDEQGAEHLLGRGDMLIKMNGQNDTKRVQCPFCSEEEVQKVTDFLRLQGEPVYDAEILKPRDEEGEAVDTSDAEADAMYDAAVRIVADTRRCSTSWLQRKLGIGYNRAAKLVEAMEKRGLVGPANGAKDREVLISPI
jgi:S-DNA-T family DNA segregation ATPase FtsK/SpoIIIE